MGFHRCWNPRRNRVSILFLSFLMSPLEQPDDLCSCVLQDHRRSRRMETHVKQKRFFLVWRKWETPIHFGNSQSRQIEPFRSESVRERQEVETDLLRNGVYTVQCLGTLVRSFTGECDGGHAVVVAAYK